MAITEITYSDFNNGESGINIRTKLNDLGNDVANLSTEVKNAIDKITLDIGYADYNDLATHTTPISVAGNSVFVDITNDGLGTYTNINLPSGVTKVWDTTLNEFDWTELSIGDMIDIRLDLTVTTTAPSQQVIIVLELGGAYPYEILFTENTFKTAGVHNINRFNGIYIGNADTLSGGGKFKIKSDGTLSVVVNGWYCKVIKR